MFIPPPSFRLVVVLLAVGLSACGSRTGLEVPDVFNGSDVRIRDASTFSDTAADDAFVRFDASDENAQAIVTSLDGLRWELPCETALNAFACTTPASRTVSATLHGQPGVRYAVTLRFRGVVETKPYDGGSSPGGYWQVGGVPHMNTINAYGLTISSPSQQYYLNRALVNAFACFEIDYEETVVLDASATVTLDAQSVDGREVRNIDTAQRPIVVPGVAPAPAPFDGQFIQMDVVAIQPAP